MSSDQRTTLAQQINKNNIFFAISRKVSIFAEKCAHIMRLGICVLCILGLFCISTIFMIWYRIPLFFGDWNKQTIYVGIIDTWHGPSKDTQAHAMWIDDDCGEGVFNVNRISNSLKIHPIYAVIPSQMSDTIISSMIQWQKQGAGIVLHGLNHEAWKEWKEEQIDEDIEKSKKVLYQKGFDTTKLLKIIVPPHGCNTQAIRSVIQKRKCKMVTGAALVNPDRNVFQLGRIFLSQDTDTSKIRRLLQKAYDNNNFVIFGTHSSNPEEFSEEKTRKVLEMAKEIGFIFDISE